MRVGKTSLPSKARSMERTRAWTPLLGIAPPGPAYYFSHMTTISLKLPEPLLARLEKESRARRTTKSSMVRECLKKQLPARAPSVEGLPKLPPGDSCYDKSLPVMKKIWKRGGRGLPDLATNPKYMKGFGK